MGLANMIGGIGAAVAGAVAKAAQKSGAKTPSGTTGAKASSGSSSGASGGKSYGGFYDKSANYEAQIQDAVAKGDFTAAAQYEQMRNNKITGEGLSYGTTDRFSDYLPGKSTAEKTGYVPGQLDSGSDYINKMYAAQKQAQIDALNARFEQFKAQNDADMANAPKQYQTSRNQSELERYKASKALKQQMADSGTTYSGQGRQATLDSENAASNRLNTINTAEQQTLDGLRLALKNAQLARDSGIAAAQTNADASAAQALLNDLYRQQDAKRDDFWNAKNFDLSESGVTGYYGGNKTLQSRYQDFQMSADQRDYELRVRELDDQLATNKITRAQYEEQLRTLKRENTIGDKYDEKMAAAELAAMQASAAGRSSGRSSSGGGSAKTYQSGINTSNYQRQSAAPTSAPTAATGQQSFAQQYGGSYSSVWGNVKTMFDKGKSKEQISRMISSALNAGGITEAGAEKMMNSLGM